MTTNVAYINPTSKVIEVAQLMQKYNVGSIPVCDQGRIVGIVTDRDIVVRNVAHGTSSQNLAVKDVMTTKVTLATPDMDINDVSKLMANKKVRRLPVVENNKVVGMVSIGDFATNTFSDIEASEALTEISK